jgi:hypothetical protein
MAFNEALQEDDAFFELLKDSYARLVGSQLVEAGHDARWLYQQAPFALLAHNTESDPRFIYANITAQRWFEYPWEEFVQLRSRFSAEPGDRSERQRVLEGVAEKGYVSGYRGVRVARSGRRFWIENGVIWQLLDAQGKYHGQAALLESWRPV